MKVDYIYRCVVTSVYDGDTCTVDIDQGFGNWKHGEKIRLYGINTPEIRGGTKESKELAKAARDRLKDLVLRNAKDKEVFIETIRDKKGKYGRYLGVLWVQPKGNEDPSAVVEVNATLVDEGHAERKEY
jgi:micrococcal nuclease